MLFIRLCSSFVSLFDFILILAMYFFVSDYSSNHGFFVSLVIFAFGQYFSYAIDSGTTGERHEQGRLEELELHSDERQDMQHSSKLLKWDRFVWLVVCLFQFLLNLFCCLVVHCLFDRFKRYIV